MVDPRGAVAAEFCEKVFTALFVRPRDWSDQQAEAHIGATVEAVTAALPRSRSDALAIVQRAGLSLKADARTNAWPTTREVLSAIRSARSGGTDKAVTDGWPHCNSEVVRESATAWVRRFGDWPGWLEHPDEVAGDLINRGTFAEPELRKAGWTPRRERAA